jgi:adenine/guanine phosphoribosyltransferase-like PRPP-binding protein
MIAACDLLTNIGAVIVDCAVMVELKALGGCAKLQAKYPSVTVSFLQHPSSILIALTILLRCGAC